MLKRAALWFGRRAVTLEQGHPTSVLWETALRCPVRTALSHIERKVVGVAAIHLSGPTATARLLRHQLDLRWDVDDQKQPLPFTLLKFEPGPSLYLRTDSKTTASRRARLRFDRSGLNAARYRLRLSPTAACPDCKHPADDADHVLLHCPQYDAHRLACRTALLRIDPRIDSLPALYTVAMGGVEHCADNLQPAILAATAPLLDAISRIAAIRRRN